MTVVGRDQAAIQPHYFDSAGARLFACYHAAANGHAAAGVLLCQPTGDEYLTAHRAARQLAIALVRAGLPVLRFEFFGVGDSAGDSGDGRPSIWCGDITSAEQQLAGLHGSPNISAVGIRLGGTLAVVHRQDPKQRELHALALWDPVVSGRECATSEPTGCPVSDAQCTELAALNLLTIRRRPAKRVLIVDTDEDNRERAAFAEHLTALGTSVEHRRVPGPPLWHEPHKTTVPMAVIQSIVKWIK